MTTNGKPRTYKRMGSTLAPYEAAERIVDLRASRAERIRQAVESVDERIAGDEMHIRQRVPEDLRHRVDVAIESLTDVDPNFYASVVSEADPDPSLSPRLLEPPPSMPAPIETTEKRARR
jgi:hypothetical protein